MNRAREHTTGLPKCIIPYGSHAKTSRKGAVCFDRMLERFAPYRMLSTAGNSRTDISGRHSAGMKLTTSEPTCQ